MSVRVGDRKLSKIEVLYQSLKLREAIEDLALRDFGIYSKNSPLRKKYNHLSRENNIDTLNDMIVNARNRVLTLSNELVDVLNAANIIYPRFTSEYEQRLTYQNQALSTCEMISKELNHVAWIFELDINCFKTIIPLLDYEKHLIIEWRKMDRQKFKGHLL